MKTPIPTSTNRKFWITIVGSISIIVLSGGYWYYVNEEAEIRDQKNKELSAIAAIKINQITHWREDLLVDAMFHSQSPFFRQGVEGLLRHPNSRLARQQMFARLSITKRKNDYENVLVTTASGDVLIAADSTTAPLDSATLHHARQAITTGKIYVSEFFLHNVSGKVFMDVVAPIINQHAQVIASVILQVNPEYAIYPLVEWWPFTTKSNETLIVRKDGDSVLFLSNLRFNKITPLTYHVAIRDSFIPAAKAALGYTGSFEGRDYRGIPVLSSIHKIPGTAWILITKVDVEELYSELYFHGKMMFVILPLIILAISATIGAILYYRQRNLYRARYQAETKLREEHEEFRTTLYSIGDGVITTDTEGKIRQMNEVAERLTGWKESQAVDMPIDRVFVIHNEETGAPALDPVHRVLKEGTVVGLTNHTVLVARDGTHHPISESGAPIYDETKKSVIGVVLVFRDQSEERQVQNALRESQEKFKQLFDAESDAIIMVDVVSGKILEANEAACTLYQFTHKELMTKKNTDLSAEPDETERITRTTQLNKEKIIFVPLRYHKKHDGTIFPVEITGRFFVWRNRSVYIAAIRDSTQRVKTEATLRKNESLLRVSQWIAKIGSYELDIATGHWTSTQALDELFGIPESYDRTVEGWENLIHPDDREVMQKYFKEDVIQARGKFHREYRIIRHSDKQERWVLGIGGLIMDKNNNPVQMVGVIQDITERKQSEISLQKSEESYRGLFNTVQDAIYIQDENGYFLDVNDGAVNMYGYSREELIGNTPEFVSAPGKNNIERISELLRKAFDGVPQQFEFWGKRANGEIFPKEVHLYKGYYFGKDVIIAVAQDISERKHAEEILRASEERYRKLIDTSPDAIAITDLNGNLVFISNKTYELFHSDSKKTKTGDNVLQWIAPAFREQATLDIRNVLYGVVTASNQYMLLREDGSTFYGEINAAPLLDSKGNPEGMVALIRDVTQRRLSEEILERREALEKELVQLSTSFVNVKHSNMNDVFNFVLERVGNFSRVDRAYIFMYDKKQTTVSNTHEWVAEGISPEIEKSQNFSTTDLPNWMEQMFRHENIHIPSVQLLPEAWNAEKKIFEAQRIQSLVAIPMVYANEFLGFIGFDSVKTQRTWGEDEIRLMRILADLFAGTLMRLRAEEEKDHLEEHVQQIQKLESIGTLASGIAHDFNNILGIIMAHVSILERLKDDNKKFASSTETVLKTINRGASLVKQILTFARKTNINLEYVNVNKAIIEVQKMLAETFPKSISLTLQLEKALPVLMLDATQFNQAILNLCVNARDAMNGQGSLFITTRLAQGSQIVLKFPAASHRDFVAVSVRDTGSGITDAVKEKIFEPFFTTKEKGKGTGLGLSVVYGVMQNHKGFVDIESEVGKGATFTLYFPLPDGIMQHESISSISHTEIPGGKETILLVEDEESLIAIAQMMMENKGYKVLTARNGEEGYELFAANRRAIDLIISDVGMPIMSGERMFELIKRTEPSIKIIFASGYIEPSVKESLIKKGAKEFIQKPFEESDFLKKVREVLDSELN